MAKTCKICGLPDTMPSVRVNENHPCSQCKKHFNLARHYPNNIEDWESYVRKAKKTVKAKSCIVGVSGGADSMFTLHLVKEMGLNPIAVHFDDGFAHSKARQNIRLLCRQMGVELVTASFPADLTLKIKKALIAASVPEVDISYEIGVSSALMTEAYKRGIKDVFVGFCFRSEGILPLEWNYLDGDYFQHLIRIQGVKTPKWKPVKPSYHFGKQQIWFYHIRHGIRFHTPLSHYPYNPSEASALLQSKYGWQPVLPHEDDPFQSFVRWYVKEKFGYDRVLFQQAALRRFQLSGKEVSPPSEKARLMATQQLHLTSAELEKLLEQPAVYPGDIYWPRQYIRLLRPAFWILYKVGLLSPKYYFKLAG